MIKVLVVDDSALVREVLTRCLNAAPDLSVIGTAVDGEEAVRKVGALKPDIVTMDIEMPNLNGFEATQKIMAYSPAPILIVTGADLPVAELSFKALGAGALDAMPKPKASDLGENSTFQKDLVARVRMLAKVPVIAHLKGRHRTSDFPEVPLNIDAPAKVVAVASSTGGPKQLTGLLQELPENLPCSVLLVQHIDDGFSEGLIRWLDRDAKMSVKLASKGDLIKPGEVYLAPNGTHLVVRPGGILGLDEGPPVEGFRPSANVLMESVARIYGANSIGVVLTGMGEDGATGVRAIHDAGGRTIAQDQQSAIVFGMPKAAIETGCVDRVLPSEEIAAEITRLVTDPFAWHREEPV